MITAKSRFNLSSFNSFQQDPPPSTAEYSISAYNSPLSQPVIKLQRVPGIFDNHPKRPSSTSPEKLMAIIDKQSFEMVEMKKKLAAAEEHVASLRREMQQVRTPETVKGWLEKVLFKQIFIIFWQQITKLNVNRKLKYPETPSFVLFRKLPIVTIE